MAGWNVSRTSYSPTKLSAIHVMSAKNCMMAICFHAMKYAAGLLEKCAVLGVERVNLTDDYEQASDDDDYGNGGE